MVSAKALNKKPDFLTLQDRQLLKRKLKIDNPLSLEGLLNQPPETKDIPDIEYQYNVTPPGGRSKGHAPDVPCVFRHGAHHWRGYVVRWRNGDRALAGKDCASEHFSFKFGVIENTFNATAKRQGNLKKLLSLRELLPSVIDEVSKFRRSSALVTYSEYIKQFQYEFSELHRALNILHRQHASQLLYTETKRDKDAEFALAERMDTQKELKVYRKYIKAQGTEAIKGAKKDFDRWADKHKQFRDDHKVAGTFIGGEIFGTSRFLPVTLLQCHENLRTLHAELLTTRSDHWQKAQYSKLMKALRALIKDIDKVFFLLNELHAFTREDNLRLISDWSTLEHQSKKGTLPYTVTRDKSTLVRSDSGAKLELRSPMKIVVFDALEHLRRTVGA